MKEVIVPEPCRRINDGKKCGRMPTIIHPEPGLYYAVCSCAGHKAFDGYYQFIGRTPEAALRQWNDWNLYGIRHDEQLIDAIAEALGYSNEYKQQKKEEIYERKNKRYIKRNQGSAENDSELSNSTDDRRKAGIDTGGLPHILFITRDEGR